MRRVRGERSIGATALVDCHGRPQSSYATRDRTEVAVDPTDVTDVMEVLMKRQITAGIAIFAVAVGVGSKLASHPDTSAGLQEVSLNQHSERSHPGTSGALARIRIRLMPDDVGDDVRAKAHNVPQIALVAE